MFALNYLSLGREHQRIAEAIRTGTVTDEIFLAGDTIRGSEQFNDCLILAMAIDQRGSTRELTVSPEIWFAPSDEEACRRLKSERSKVFFYHNYIHGQVTLARFLLPLVAVETLRELYRIAITLVLGAGIAVTMLRLTEKEWDSLPLFVSLITFARFFGLEAFGQSLGHGPSDFILIGFVALLALRSNTIFASAIFGALTAIFELMTGGFPLGLCVVIGLTWFSLNDKSVSAVWRCVAAYLVAFGTALALKYASVWLVFGTDAFLSIAAEGASRTGGNLPAFATGASLGGQVAGNLDALISGLGTMAGLFVVLGFGFGIWGIQKTPQSRLLAFSVLPVFLWILIFRQHTIIHAFFMDRIFVWIIAAGFSLFALRCQLDNNDRPMLRRSGPHIGG